MFYLHATYLVCMITSKSILGNSIYFLWVMGYLSYNFLIFESKSFKAQIGLSTW